MGETSYGDIWERRFGIMHEDWKNVFGQVPDSFSARVYYTVKDLPDTKKSPKRFLFPKRFVIGLCTLAIILTSAMAAGQ